MQVLWCVHPCTVGRFGVWACGRLAQCARIADTEERWGCCRCCRHHGRQRRRRARRRVPRQLVPRRLPRTPRTLSSADTSPLKLSLSLNQSQHRYMPPFFQLGSLASGPCVYDTDLDVVEAGQGGGGASKRAAPCAPPSRHQHRRGLSSCDVVVAAISICQRRSNGQARQQKCKGCGVARWYDANDTRWINQIRSSARHCRCAHSACRHRHKSARGIDHRPARPCCASAMRRGPGSNIRCYCCVSATGTCTVGVCIHFSCCCCCCCCASGSAIGTCTVGVCCND
jgi:hypothetical protein